MQLNSLVDGQNLALNISSEMVKIRVSIWVFTMSIARFCPSTVLPRWFLRVLIALEEHFFKLGVIWKHL